MNTQHLQFLVALGATTSLFAATRPITDVFGRADPATGRVTIHADVHLPFPSQGSYTFAVEVLNTSTQPIASGKAAVALKGGRDSLAVETAVPSPSTWSPQQPALYQVRCRLLDYRGLTVDQETLRIGFRSIERRGADLFLNRQPVFLRGFSGETQHGSLTSDHGYIRKRIQAAKSYGFNAERHHSHFPPEAYLDVADELGLLQQIEIHSQLRQGLGSPEFEATRQLWIELVKLGRRHPSVVVYSMGNEIYQNDPKVDDSMRILYDLAKHMDPGTLVLNRSGSVPGNDVAGKYDFIERPIGEYEHSGKLAGAAFEMYLRGERKGLADKFPIIAHEYPLASAYPRLEKMMLYPEPPTWMKAAEENARRGDYLDLMPRFASNAEAIQWRIVKQMIEEARKFPELDGYSMLRLNDTGPDTGGILDDFSNPKSLTTSEFLMANGPTAILADWGDQVVRSGDRFNLRLLLSHHLNSPLGGILTWRIASRDREWEKGTLPVKVDGFGTSSLGEVSVKLPEVEHPARFVVETVLGDSVRNKWDFWIFPPSKQSKEKFIIFDPNGRLKGVTELFPDARIVRSGREVRASRDLLVTDSWPAWLDGFLESGGRVLLLSDKNWKQPEELGNHGNHLAYFTSRAPVALPELDEPLTHWLTIPSNYARRWGNSGTVIDPHPALGDFPHEGFADFQFFRLIRRAKSFWLDRLPSRAQPIIRAIDNYWHGNNKAYLLEFGAGNGKVLASTLNFTQHLNAAPEVDYLLTQLVQYAGSTEFRPRTKFSVGALRTVIEQFQKELPELTKKIGDPNAPPDKFRYNPLSGDMN